MSLVLNIIEKIDIVQAEIPLFCTISRLYLIPQLSTAPQLPAANGADLRRGCPRLMGVRLPLCRRASGCWAGAFMKVPAYSRTPVVAARRGSGRPIRKFSGVGFR